MGSRAYARHHIQGLMGERGRRTRLTLEQYRLLNSAISRAKPRCKYCGFILLDKEDRHLPSCKKFKPRGKITRARRFGPPPPTRQLRFDCDMMGDSHTWASADDGMDLVCMDCGAVNHLPPKAIGAMRGI